MARRRRNKKPSLAEGVIGLMFALVLIASAKHGGAMAALLANIFAGLLFLAVLLGIGVVAVKLLRKKETAAQPVAPRTYKAGAVVPPSDLVFEEFRRSPENGYSNSVADEKWTEKLIHDLEWKRFEELCCGVWKAKGYSAELTKAGADDGVDVLLRDKGDPHKIFAVIQCKAWAESVGVEPIRALWGTKDHFDAKLAIFYGRSGFTTDARKFAREKHLSLQTAETLYRHIRTLPEDVQTKLLGYVTRGDYKTPTCPSCDEKMVQRAGRKPFWGCRNFPRCRNTMAIRRLSG